MLLITSYQVSKVMFRPPTEQKHRRKQSSGESVVSSTACRQHRSGLQQQHLQPLWFFLRRLHRLHQKILLSCSWTMQQQPPQLPSSRPSSQLQRPRGPWNRPPQSQGTPLPTRRSSDALRRQPSLLKLQTPQVLHFLMVHADPFCSCMEQKTC